MSGACGGGGGGRARARAWWWPVRGASGQGMAGVVAWLLLSLSEAGTRAHGKSCPINVIADHVTYSIREHEGALLRCRVRDVRTDATLQLSDWVRAGRFRMASITWRKLGQPQSIAYVQYTGDDRVVNSPLSSSHGVRVSQSDALIFDTVTKQQDEARYVCHMYVIDGRFNCSSEAQLNLFVLEQPVIATIPRTTHALEGSSMQMICARPGYVTYAWRLSRQSEAPVFLNGRNLQVEFSSDSGGAIAITKIQRFQEGNYSCKVGNGYDTSNWSAPYYLDVYYQPTLILYNITKVSTSGRSEVALSVYIKSNPPTVTATWSRRATQATSWRVIEPSPGTRADCRGLDSVTHLVLCELTYINNTGGADGDHRVVLTNAAGNLTVHIRVLTGDAGTAHEDGQVNQASILIGCSCAAIALILCFILILVYYTRKKQIERDKSFDSKLKQRVIYWRTSGREMDDAYDVFDSVRQSVVVNGGGRLSNTAVQTHEHNIMYIDPYQLDLPDSGDHVTGTRSDTVYAEIQRRPM